jgi:hypothetical protein
MYDCYQASCAHPKCKVNIPIHISDFCLDREDFKVYCKKHMPKMRGSVIIDCIGADKAEKIKKGDQFEIVFNPDVKFPAKCCHHNKSYGGIKRKCLHPKIEAVSINSLGRFIEYVF